MLIAGPPVEHSVLQHLTSLKILSQLCEIYYRNTGMLISFQDPGSESRIVDYPKDQKSEYCKLIQASPEGLERCRECDRQGLAAARAVYLSPNYFSSLFRRVAGSIFRSYLVRKRIKAARSGFKDCNYFNRTLTSVCGTTPARFRCRGRRKKAS